MNLENDKKGLNKMDKLVYKATLADRNYYVVSRTLGELEWYSGYLSVKEEEKINDPEVTFIGMAKEVIPSYEIDPEEKLIGIDTADPANNDTTLGDVVNELAIIARQIDETNTERDEEQ